MRDPRHRKSRRPPTGWLDRARAAGRGRGRARSPGVLRGPITGVDRAVVVQQLPRPRPRRPLGHRSRPHRYGLVATGADGRVVAHAGWERDPDRPERAEIAFAIADAMQHNGLGTILLGQLIEAADQAGVAVLSAEALPQNHRMLHVFRDSGFPVTTRTLPGVVLVELPTSRAPAALNLRTPRAASNKRSPSRHAGSLRA